MLRRKRNTGHALPADRAAASPAIRRHAIMPASSSPPRHRWRRSRVLRGVSDPFDLDRFVSAQDACWPAPLEELARGRKTGHWMWFVFPQIAGLGRSTTARHFAIRTRAEARAYLAHPVLGLRLRIAAKAMFAAPGSAAAILGLTDAIKLRSSMTLFAATADDTAPFDGVLARFFGGEPDPATLTLIDEGN